MQDWLKGLVESLELNTFFVVYAVGGSVSFWYDENGNYTDDPKKLVRKEVVDRVIPKTAETPEEYKLVYDRAFVNSKLENNAGNHQLFIRQLKMHLKELEEKHIALRDFSTTDFKLLDTLESFLNYLDPYMMTNPKPMTDLAIEIHAKRIDKLPYDIDTFRFFSFDSAIKIKYHYDPNESLEDYNKMVFTHENFQLIIHFEKEFNKANEQESVNLLENQFGRIGITGVPPEVWLNNVESIIDHHKLLKRPHYAKHDSVKLWFKEKREELSKNQIKEVPFIGELFHRNLNITDVVTDAYYGLVRQPTKREDVSTSYVGRLHWHNQPYQSSFFGGYINMDTLDLLYFHQKEKISPFDRVSEEDVTKGLKDYAAGFKKGYHSFDLEKLDKNPFRDSTHKAKIIFDFVTGRWRSAGTLPISMGNGGNYFASWNNAGFEAGQLYRAWYLIIENHSIFTPLFEDFRKEQIKNKQVSGGNQTPHLSLNQIALFYVFDNRLIDRKNSNEIAISYGYSSGEKLFQKFSHFSKRANRLIEGETQRKLENRIDLYESIIDNVAIENRAILNSELDNLKQRLI